MLFGSLKGLGHVELADIHKRRLPPIDFKYIWLGLGPAMVPKVGRAHPPSQSLRHGRPSEPLSLRGS